MTPEQMRKLDTELREYFESMVEGMGRLERRRALEMYLTGLLLDGERKSVEPMAGRLVEEPAKREAVRQRLQQCVSVADWSDEEMRRRLAMKLEAELPQLEALVVDDTGFPKKGEYSVGVARQYSGTLGRTDNCLPEEWTRSRKRCKPANTPSRSWCDWRSCAGGWSAITRRGRVKSASTTLKAAPGEASTTTPPSAWWPMVSSPYAGRFFPRRSTPWTLPEVRRRLQHLLLRRIGHCPLCLRRVGARAPPRGPSRI